MSLELDSPHVPEDSQQLVLLLSHLSPSSKDVSTLSIKLPGGMSTLPFLGGILLLLLTHLGYFLWLLLPLPIPGYIFTLATESPKLYALRVLIHFADPRWAPGESAAWVLASLVVDLLGL